MNENTNPSGPWSADEADAFLRSCTFPLRLAVNGGDGYPRQLSLWYLWEDDVLRCATHRDSHVVAWLRADPRCGFELAPNEPPYYGLRGAADAVLAPLGDDPLLERLIDRYLGKRDSYLARWLLSRRDEELVLSLRPSRLVSWDYRERMRRG